jgi:hypothetical protein
MLIVLPMKVRMIPILSQQNRRLLVLPKPSFFCTAGPLLGGLDVGGKGFPPGPVMFVRVETVLLGEVMMLCATNATKNTRSRTIGYAKWV